jgi:phage FluMu protein Com
MCGRLGVEPGELKKVITAETGFDPERSNYIRTADGGFKLDAKGRKIAQAKGLGSWLHSTAIRVAGMTEEQWQNLEKMPAMAQLPFLERTFRAMGVRGLTAEQIHVRQFGTGFMKTNPTLPGGGRSIYIGKAWWESEAGKKWLKEHPEYKSQALRQYNMYEQNKQVDQDGKGYITEEDVAKTTVRCKRCNKVLYHCKCPKVKVVSVTKEETTSGTNYKVRLEVDQWGRKPKRRSTTQKAPSAGVRCDPNVTSCVDPSNPDKPLGVSQ